MPKNIKDSARFLLDSGLLFEINRKVLHPFGLALSVEINDDGRVKYESIWDCREDPEGILYGEEVYKDGLEKFQKFLEEFGTERLKTRQELLGFIVQELEGKSNGNA